MIWALPQLLGLGTVDATADPQEENANTAQRGIARLSASS